MSEQSTKQSATVSETQKHGFFVQKGEAPLEGKPPDLEIRIVKHKKIMTIYDTYVVFSLVTDTNRAEFAGRHFEVDRRYSEFEWLHSRLVQAHPSLFVPSLPGKMAITTLDRFADPFLLSRQQGLQTFLKRLARHPLLSANPDLIAFLSFLKDDFAQYRTSHPSTGTLATMISETRRLVQNRVPSLCEDQESNEAGSHPTDLGVGLIGSKAMQQYEHEFRGYAEETESFLTVAQRMARVTEIVVSNLDGLGYGFEELSRCLSTWPARLIVELDGQSITDSDSLASLDASSTTRTSATLQWSRQRPLAPETLAKASQKAFQATSELGTTLRTTVLADWKEMATYAQAVRGVFNTRDNLEKRYFDTIDELRSETENANRKSESRLVTLAKAYLPWRQRSPSELASEACHLQDQLTLSNGQIGAEYNRWSTERCEDTIASLLRMSRAYLSYWTSVADAWREAVNVLENVQHRQRKQPPHAPEVDPNPGQDMDPEVLQPMTSAKEPRILNRHDLENDLDSDEFYLAPADQPPSTDDWTPSDSPDFT